MAVTEAHLKPARYSAGWMARTGVKAGLAIGLLGLVAIVPEFQASRIAFAAIFAIIGLSMNMLLGYAGQISLGHQAFVGIGAFTSAYVVTEMKLDFLMGIAIATLVGALSAALLGAVALRVRGLYLALVTLAYGAVAERTIFLFRPLTGGGAGLEAPRPEWAVGDAAYAYLCIGVLALVLYIDTKFTSSKAGRAVQAVRDSERVAASMGINVTNYKLLAFVLSGALAGLAGGLYGHRDLFVVAAPFSFFLALEFVLMTVVGGLGSRWGVVAGSVFFALLDKFFEDIFRFITELPGLSGLANVFKTPALLVPAIGSLLLIVTLIQFPGGIGQQLRPLLNWLRGGKFDLSLIHDEGPAQSGGPDVRP